MTQRLSKVHLFDIPYTIGVRVVYHRNTESLNDVQTHGTRSGQTVSISSAYPQLTLVQNVCMAMQSSHYSNGFGVHTFQIIELSREVVSERHIYSRRQNGIVIRYDTSMMLAVCKRMVLVRKVFAERCDISLKNGSVHRKSLIPVWVHIFQQ